MIRAPRGAAVIAGLCATALLTGCAGPMGLREAEMRATHGLNRFCQDSPCGPVHLVKAQKIKDRWLVDFDAPQGKYTVAVDESGGTDVSIWDKNQLR